MGRIPQIGLMFLLTKQDSNDFDRDAVSQKLHIVPTETSEPQVSEGKVNSNSNIQDIVSKLKGISLFPLSESSYQVLKHAYWCLDLFKINSWCLEEVLQKMEAIFQGKEVQVKDLCEMYNLKAELIIRIYADCAKMPEVSIVNEKVKYWAQMGVDICFDFYLD